ncbi:hypothetical protein BVX99_01915, partial [bacterium F16]
MINWYTPKFAWLSMSILLSSMSSLIHVHGVQAGITVAASGDPSHDIALQRFAETAERDVNLFLTSLPKAPPIIFYSTPLHGTSPWKTAIRINPSLPPLEQGTRIISALIARRLPASANHPPPSWLIAGIYHRVQHGQPSNHLENDLPASTTLVNADYQISLNKLLTTDVGLTRPPIYSVFADMCAAMLHVIHRQSSTAISTMIVRNNPCSTAELKYILNIEGTNTDAWFATRFVTIAKRPYLTANETVKELDALLRAHILPEDPDGTIENLLRALETDHVSQKSKRDFLTQCYQLRLKCPTLLANSLDMFIHASSVLHSNKDNDFLKQAPTAWLNLLKSRDYSNAITTYLHHHSRSADDFLYYADVAQNPAAALLDYEKYVKRFLRES